MSWDGQDQANRVELRAQCNRQADTGYPQALKQRHRQFPQWPCSHPRPQAQDQFDSCQALPSMVHLIQVTPRPSPKTY
jgi:hypothetical protein